MVYTYEINNLRITDIEKNYFFETINNKINSDKYDIIVNNIKNIIAGLDKFRFPGKAVNDFLIKNKKTTCLTGSYLLYSLTNETSEDWKSCPVGDIDIFTNDKNVLNDLDKIFDKSIYSISRNDTMTNIYNSYIPGICDIYEYTFKNSKEFDIKIQLIIVNDKDINKTLQNFDFEFVKAKYNGEQVSMSLNTFKSIITRETSIKSQFLTENKFARTLKRCHKYMLRGYNIHLPDKVCIDKPIHKGDAYIEKFYQWNEQYRAFILKNTSVDNTIEKSKDDSIPDIEDKSKDKYLDNFYQWYEQFGTLFDNNTVDESDDDLMPDLIPISDIEDESEDVSEDDSIPDSEDESKDEIQDIINILKIKMENKKKNYETKINNLTNEINKLKKQYIDDKQKIFDILNNID